jgi:procollagen-lysine,2-oxoglutarate 5-dioxygenase
LRVIIILNYLPQEWHAREAGIKKCVDLKCDYYFSVDADAHLDNPLAIQLLVVVNTDIFELYLLTNILPTSVKMVQNRGILAPMLIRPYKAWSNFWGALNNEGRLHDVM